MASDSTQRAAAIADRLQRERDALAARASGCDHSVTCEGPRRAFAGPVAEARPGSRYNEAAHGNIEVTETCSTCQATRRVLINGAHREMSGWHAATAEIEQQIRAARAEAHRQRQLDQAEGAAWRGDMLEVPGAAPVRVQIGTYSDDGHHVDLRLDGVGRVYAIAELEQAATDHRLDAAQRTAWGLIARRAARASKAVRS